MQPMKDYPCSSMRSCIHAHIGNTKLAQWALKNKGSEFGRKNDEENREGIGGEVMKI